MNEEQIKAAKAAWQRDPETAAQALLGMSAEEVFIHAIRGCNQHIHAKGFADNFSTTVAPNSIYAGAVYTNKKGVIERTARRVTGERFGPKRNRTDGLNWSEFVTSHLEKLVCSKSKFTKLWNYKRNGKYYWREGFIESLRVIFEK